MPKFAANLGFLFTEVPLAERLGQAAAAGFPAVEIPVPYTIAPQDLARRADAAGLEVALINLPAGNWDAGERGIACHPDRIAEFRDGVGRAIDYARALRCPRANCLAGIAPAGVGEPVLHKTLVENLRHAAQAFDRAGLTLLIEPISTRAIPGFFLNTSARALAIMDEVGAPNLKLQYDIFHMQVMEGDLAMTLQRELARIGHVQFADVPGRHEPGTGEINFPFLFGWLDSIGYAGWVGAEYTPTRGTGASLAWLRPGTAARQ